MSARGEAGQMCGQSQLRVTPAPLLSPHRRPGSSHAQDIGMLSLTKTNPAVGRCSEGRQPRETRLCVNHGKTPESYEHTRETAQTNPIGPESRSVFRGAKLRETRHRRQPSLAQTNPITSSPFRRVLRDPERREGERVTLRCRTRHSLCAADIHIGRGQNEPNAERPDPLQARPLTSHSLLSDSTTS